MSSNVAPHMAVGFAIGLGLGLYDTIADGLLFTTWMVALLVALHVLAWVWPLAFPSS